MVGKPSAPPVADAGMTEPVDPTATFGRRAANGFEDAAAAVGVEPFMAINDTGRQPRPIQAPRPAGAIRRASRNSSSWPWQRRAAQIFDFDASHAATACAQQFGRALRQIDDAPADERTAVVDTHHERRSRCRDWSPAGHNSAAASWDARRSDDGMS